MKPIYIYLTLLLSLTFVGCEEVVDVDTKTAPPRLVVDASLQWEKGTAGNEQKIKLTMTTNFYNTIPPVVSGATVYVTNSASTVFNFIETPGTGEYVCSSFVPEIGESYTLTVEHNGRTITATEAMMPVPAIDYIAQETIPGFEGEEEQIQFKTYFTDNGTTNDYYLMRFQSSVTAIPEYIAVDDEFFQGNQVFGLYLNADLEPGGLLGVKLYGISQRYFNYMEKLISISYGAGPFATPAGVLRGNMVNTTNPDDYVLGYFSVTETSSQVYTVGPY
ncbi:DUF4249 domain-containing protein [Flavobacterium caeni]|uniref:DUF4249 domain-containing protein n=1 Tax=Flavobacterium caeni TaxID=490189 RepID=A0A1G5K661_9FLAO|nr:DUF4249 domain-containing protein [Flavobacterium caeni]SCY95409.1 protein of unknown function [Flavobacterium caeni]